VTKQIARDLETALAISSYSSQHIEFLVADRDGDHLPERLRYAWDPARESILWHYNQAPPEVLAEQISEFELFLQPAPALPHPDNHQHSQTVLLHALDAPAQTTIEEWLIGPNQGLAQYFVPWLPDDSSHWDLGSIKIQLRAVTAGHPGQLRIRLHRSSNFQPANRVGEWFVPVRQLTPDFQWFELPIGSIGELADLSSTEPLCITLTQIGGGTPGVAVQVIGQAGSDSPSSRLLSSANGSSWVSVPNTLGFRFYALGFHASQPPRQLAQRVELSLRGPAEQPRTERSIPLRNRPELL
jgi:hypothetical protein